MVEKNAEQSQMDQEENSGDFPENEMDKPESESSPKLIGRENSGLSPTRQGVKRASPYRNRDKDEGEGEGEGKDE